MTIKVLVVDDSHFICKLIKRALEEDPDFQVIDFAYNGEEAVSKTKQLEPDVITMDVEMPVMDGISAVKAIMAETPTPILMFSSMTQFGAKATLDALAAGAVDFLPKQFEDIDGNQDKAKQYLRHRIRIVALQAANIKFKVGVNRTLAPSYVSAVRPSAKTHVSSSPSLQRIPNRLRLLVVVASTGGPVAVQNVLTKLPASCPLPILVVQHMPATFTKSFAERLDQICQISVAEAQQGSNLEVGKALIAPGGLQLEVRDVAGKLKIELTPKVANDIYAPCADISLASVAKSCAEQSLTVVLTGMGADGKEGAKKLKQVGASVWAQNEESCVIYGMPKAVIDAKLADRVLSLDDIANEFKKLS